MSETPQPEKLQQEGFIKIEELTEVMAGTADDATREKVSNALRDPNHPLSYMITRAESQRHEDEVEPTDEQIAGITNDEPTVVEKENVDPWQAQLLKAWAQGSNTDPSDEKTIS